jgi:hypothetical protein
MQGKISRRGFLAVSTVALAGSAMGTLGTSLYEPHETTISQIEIVLKRLPPAFEGIRIAQLSDIHFNSFMTKRHLEKVVALTNAQKPDCVVLTGDFVTAEENKKSRIGLAEFAWPCAEVLRTLTAPLGCFAVLGNHDYETKADVVVEALSAGSKIQVLRNQANVIERDGARLWVAGIDDAIQADASPSAALRGVPPQECTIVAVHEPDFADELRKFPVDFQMSGHSHGGQIRFPLVGALYLPPLAHKYSLGHYQIGELQLYTNRGIGVIGLPMRFMCPPEITIFTLKSARS